MGIISQITDWVTTPYTIYLVFKDPAIPRSVKWRAGIGLAVIFAYVISPVDIIPDFIPFAGWLDDIIIVPLGLALVRKFTPGFDIVGKRARAQASVKRIILWTIFSLVVAVLLGLAWLGLMIYFIVRLITG
jgi:uncharacterized membrane protein YkvA (DUF1232 family)